MYTECVMPQAVRKSDLTPVHRHIHVYNLHVHVVAIERFHHVIQIERALFWCTAGACETSVRMAFLDYALNLC